MYAFVAPIDGMELTDPLAYRRSELLGAAHNGSLSRVTAIVEVWMPRAESRRVSFDAWLVFPVKNSWPYNVKLEIVRRQQRGVDSRSESEMASSRFKTRRRLSEVSHRSWLGSGRTRMRLNT